jgi:NADH-quinone oxidoreductase subunit F
VKLLERIDSGEATPIDLDVMEDMNKNIIGNCLCVLGDSMAAPIISMLKHFRPEFESHIERAARLRADERVGEGMPDLAHAASAPGEAVA